MSLVVRTPQPLNILPRGVEVNIDDEEDDSQQSRRLVCVGDRIVSNASGGISRGHGTTLCQGHVVATVCGEVERVNKLVIVRPLKSKYNPEVGDVVVGRVVEVVGKRWKVDINAKHSGTLLLSAVNLPGGVQRRRTAEDELNMRSVLVESDLVCTEIQQLFQLDGSIMLHTRSSKYGKLKGGQVVRVPANLVRRQKAHFVHLEELGMDIILGCNGFVWVGVHQANRQPVDPEASGTAAKAGEMSEALRENLVRMANAVRVLDRLYRPITVASTLEVFQLSIKHCVAAKLMLEPSFLQLLADHTAQDMDTGR